MNSFFYRFFLTTLFLVSIPAFSETHSYSCKAGIGAPLYYRAKIEDKKITMEFRASSENQYAQSVSSDLNNKKVSLSLEESRSKDALGWKIYTGKIQVSALFQEYRHFEMSLSPQTPNGKNVVNGHLAISPRSLSNWPDYFSQYKLECNLER